MSEEGLSKSEVEYLRVFVEHTDPILTATEVGDALGNTQQAAHAMLTKLRGRGYLKSKKVGARSVVWWITTDGLEAYKDAVD